jgi:hypothetical protein
MNLNLFQMGSLFTTDNLCVLWSQQHGLLPNGRKCRSCRIPMRIDFNRHGVGLFRYKKGCPTFSLATGTWFSKSKLEIRKQLALTYCFCRSFSYEQAINETSFSDLETSPGTLCDWFSYCREVCMDALDREYENQGRIGGLGHIVELDKTKIGHRKYNRGCMIDGSWILGMIDLGTEDEPSNNYRLEICPGNKCDAATLLPLIEKHVLLGTTIMSDCWRAYNGLEAMERNQ